MKGTSVHSAPDSENDYSILLRGGHRTGSGRFRGRPEALQE